MNLDFQKLIKTLKESQGSDGAIKLDEKTVDLLIAFLKSVSTMVDEQSKIINQLLVLTMKADQNETKPQ